MAALLLVALPLAACAGKEAPAVPEEPEVVEAPTAAEEPVEVAMAEYVGSATCGTCHEETYETFMKSGHPWKLTKVVDSQPPEYPFTEVPNPPEGYTWDDVTYVIGGYNWKARFIGTDGFIITGDETATTQYNFPNPITGHEEPGWVAYHAGEEKPYDCGRCHTTGYSDDPDTHQDDLPGLIGTWAEPGVQCEACHGPGSLHAADPEGVHPEIDRSIEQCGQCHVRGGPEAIDASGGFIRHHEQYDELFQGKMALDCVTCHDPHAGVIQLRKTGEQTTLTKCEDCHADQAEYQDSEVHPSVAACIDCHMPRVTQERDGQCRYVHRRYSHPPDGDQCGTDRGSSTRTARSPYRSSG